MSGTYGYVIGKLNIGFFKALFYNRKTVVKTKSWIELWNSISSFGFWIPFCSPILLTLWFRYLQTCLKENCIYLSCQLFKTSNKNLKFQERCILQRSADLNCNNFPFGVHHGATLRGHQTKQTVKKLNLWGVKRQ